MQWSPDRNAGFSRADPQQLFLPPIMDPVYGYQAVNVEAQTRDRSSLLNWMKRLLQVRRASQAFGRGTLRFIRPGNRRVLAYLRQYGGDTILCVANLARSAQPVELDLSEHKGSVPIELLGRSAFPPIGELPYLLTLPGYAFYWFRLSREAEAPPWHEERLPRESLPVLVLVQGWNSFFPERVTATRGALAKALRARLENEVVPAFLAAQRWAQPPGESAAESSSARAGPSPAVLRDCVLPQADLERWLLGIYDVASGRQRGCYFLPLALAFEDGDEARNRRLQPASLAQVRQHATLGLLADASADEDFCRRLVAMIGAARELPTEHGRLHAHALETFSTLRESAGELGVGPTGTQGGNTTMRVGDTFFLKICRRLQRGPSPGVEIGRYLTEVAHFAHSVPLAGYIEYQPTEGEPSTLVLLQGFVTNQGDAWDYTVNHLVRYLEERVAQVSAEGESHGLYLALVTTLAQRTAQLHATLAAAKNDAAFAPRPFTSADVQAQARAARAQATAALQALGASQATLPPEAAVLAAKVFEHRGALLRSLAARGLAARGLNIRCHGDYHLRQVLLKRNDFVITDFEGPPQLSVAERRRKRSPLTDVTTMLASFAYARAAALRRSTLIAAEERGKWEPLLLQWEQQVRRAFLSAYADTASAHGLFGSLAQLQPLLRVFELQLACADLRRELSNPAEWTGVALQRIAMLTALR
jgi:maltose alpha-D-glucosyltransferase/alpha-amylase